MCMRLKHTSLTKYSYRVNNGEVENNWKAGEFTFKNKSQFQFVPTWKIPVSFTEGAYDTKAFNLLVKYDTNGKTSCDLKLKQLSEGLTVTSKTANGKVNLDGEVVAEYLLPGTNVHSSLSFNSNNKFAFSTAFKPTKNFTVGAEVTGNTSFNNLKLAVSDQVMVGKTVFGARLTQDFTSGATQIEGVVGFTEGSTDMVMSANHSFASSGLPSATFLVKHNIDKNLWVKAAVNDALEVKIASGYKINDNLNTTFGLAVSQNAKNPADLYRVGLKAVFSL